MKLTPAALITFLTAILLSSVSGFAQSVLDDVEKYVVRVKASIGYPFAEDDAETFNGAGFLIDKQKGWYLSRVNPYCKLRNPKLLAQQI